MRIIRGIHRGRSIIPPKGFRARPTTDYARESLFNIIENRFDITTLDVLDLFSGTGSITYEFESREDRSVEFVELNKLNYRYITSVLNELRLTDIRGYNTDVRIYLRKCVRKFDLIFADPPYDLKWIGGIPSLIAGAGILKPGGTFILEHSSGVLFNDIPGFTEHRYYGSVNFSFFSF